jgi:hypothetical protein
LWHDSKIMWYDKCTSSHEVASDELSSQRVGGWRSEEFAGTRGLRGGHWGW